VLVRAEQRELAARLELAEHGIPRAQHVIERLQRARQLLRPRTRRHAGAPVRRPLGSMVAGIGALGGSLIGTGGGRAHRRLHVRGDTQSLPTANSGLPGFFAAAGGTGACFGGACFTAGRSAGVLRRSPARDSATREGRRRLTHRRGVARSSIRSTRAWRTRTAGSWSHRRGARFAAAVARADHARSSLRARRAALSDRRAERAARPSRQSISAQSSTRRGCSVLPSSSQQRSIRSNIWVTRERSRSWSRFASAASSRRFFIRRVDELEPIRATCSTDRSRR